jgi:tripartite-type tricarboxylate transporter receptor subunit TctC
MYPYSTPKEETTMRNWLSRLTAPLCAAMALLAGPAAAQQDYPNRPVKIIVGHPPGGVPDLVARAYARRLGELLGQSFLVENRPGAAGTTATAQVARMPADGYTLMAGETGQLFVAPYLYRNLGYDTLRDFTPISMVATGGVLLVVNATSPIRNLQDLIREAKANPGKLDYGSSGVGSIHHISMATFFDEAGIELMHVPYKGSGQSITAVLAGEVPVLATSVATAGPHIAAGKLVPLGVTTSYRASGLPNVPSIGETFKDYDFASETGFLAPAGLPAPVLDKLAQAIRQASESPEIFDYFRVRGIDIRYTTPAQYAANMRASLKRYERAVRVSKIPKAD